MPKRRTRGKCPECPGCPVCNGEMFHMELAVPEGMGALECEDCGSTFWIHPRRMHDDIVRKGDDVGRD